MLVGNIVYRRIDLRHKEDILAFVREHFSGQNILRRMLKCDLDEEIALDQARVTHYLENGVCYGIYVSGQLVAANFNMIKEKGKTTPKLILPTFRDPNLELATCLVVELENEIFKQLNATKIFFSCISVVHKEFKKQGILKKLFYDIIKISPATSCDYWCTVAITEFYPKNISILKEIKYSDYVDKRTGIKPFQNCVVKPHTHARLLVYPLKHSSKL